MNPYKGGYGLGLVSTCFILDICDDSPFWINDFDAVCGLVWENGMFDPDYLVLSPRREVELTKSILDEPYAIICTFGTKTENTPERPIIKQITNRKTHKVVHVKVRDGLDYNTIMFTDPRGLELLDKRGSEW